ncbi:glycosyltransferase [Dechloromonas sp. XY25]|uniref:Glycosyltransferase n=1 Tax=Dechloromonas hankyongensis TaxID=2908002 RepID=A0ABS9JZE9_9RHOO|nr:glycosyltransferase [Dechloromonas hankyongensis]MCG2576277.1 glycosyltransferase [Dechloromonas hankyongensis]
MSIPRMERLEAQSGLHEYRVWSPYLPRFGRQIKWVVNAKALASQARLALEDFIQRFGKPDLIHAQAVYPGGAAAVALGKAYGIAVGLTEHLGPFPPPTLCLPSGQVMPLVVDAYGGASLCSAVSQSLAHRVRELGLANEVTVLPNFLPDQFGLLADQRSPAGSGFSFLSVGGPSHAKGTDVLLKALAKVSSGVTLRVVGDGPEMAFFQHLADDLGLSERVRWLGAIPRDQMPEHYQTCDAFVLPSQGETFGVAFIEALAFGKPLIATRCGGPEEIVNARNGLLVPMNSVDDLVVAMQDMVAHAGRYKPEILRADFLARFSASGALARIEAWYHAVVRTGELKVAS